MRGRGHEHQILSRYSIQTLSCGQHYPHSLFTQQRAQGTRTNHRNPQLVSAILPDLSGEEDEDDNHDFRA